MIAVLATLVFAAAGCVSAAVIGTSIRNALPAVRRLAAAQGSLAEDRVFLVSLIESPRHDGTPAPAARIDPAPVHAAERIVAMASDNRRARMARPFSPAKLPAAA
jgi:hypothetical protein